MTTLNADQTVAIDSAYFWQPMSTCPPCGQVPIANCWAGVVWLFMEHTTVKTRFGRAGHHCLSGGLQNRRL